MKTAKNVSQQLNRELNEIAGPYVKLVLAVGQHDADYVDAYYGPAEWQAEAKTNKQSLDSILQAALPLKLKLDSLHSKRHEEILHLRHHYLHHSHHYPRHRCYHQANSCSPF